MACDSPVSLPAQLTLSQLAPLLANLSESVVMVDSHWQILYQNPAAERLSGGDGSRIGQTYWETYWQQWLIPAEEQARYQQAMRLRQPDQFEQRYEQAGAERWLAVRLCPSEAGLNLFLQDITHRKQAEIAVAATDQRFQAVFNQQFQFMAMLTPQGQVTEANAACFRGTGVTREAVIGRYFWETPWWNQLPELKELWHRSLAVLSGSDPVTGEGEYRLADGSIRYADYAITGLRDAQNQVISVIVEGRDITDRRRAEAALAESEARYRTLANAVPLMLWINDASGQPEFFNDQLYRYVGDRAPQLRQPTDWIQHVLAEDLAEIVAIRHQSLESGSAYEVEVRIRRTDGIYRWHLVRVVPQKQAGQVIAWFGTATDIHDTKQLALDNAQLYQQAQEANRIKDEFLAVLSHELRSPLNPILGWVRLLRTRQFDTAATQRALEIIERNAKLQTQLIEDLLDISRILRGKMSLSFAPVNLISTIEAALETVCLSAEQKEIALLFLPPAQPLYISGDTGRLQQIIWNLFSNAIKFTASGGRVELRLQAQGQGFAQITITDSGKGIHPDFLPHVFESFRQEDSKTTRSFGGLGLGLAIVRHLCELHGGTVQVASPGEGQGATFTVLLPLIAPAAYPVLTPGLPDSSQLCLAGLTILVVDDEADARALSATLLEQAGALVQVAASATAALALLAGNRPDLLISDIGMPEIDGYMLMRQIRQREDLANLPAIALTAYARSEDQTAALEAGFQAHLTKPVNSSELIERVVALCRRR